MENYENFCYILRFIFPEIIFLFFLDIQGRVPKNSQLFKSVIFRVPHHCFCSLHMHVVVANKIRHGIQNVRSSHKRCSKNRDALSRNKILRLRKQSKFWGN